MASGKTLYIKGDRDVEVTKPDVTLADLLSMECSDQSLLPKLKTMKILKFKKTGLKTFVRFGEISRKGCRSRTEIVLDMHMS